MKERTRDFTNQEINCQHENLEPRLMLSGTQYVVDSLADTVANDGAITLREAIQAANTNTAVCDALAGSSIDMDEITFDASLFTDGSNPITGTITLNGTELSITDDLSITGPDQDLLIIDADDSSRVILAYTSGIQIEISDLTITGGYVNTTGVPGYRYGGGIYNKATMTLTNVTVTDNWTLQYGGGIFNAGDMTLNNVEVSYNSGTEGSGVFNGNTMSIEDSDIHHNLLSVTGSGTSGLCNYYDSNPVYNGPAEITISYTSISNNTGKGIYNMAEATISNTTISENSNTGSAGGIYNMNLGDMTISDSVIINNTASGHGGGIYSSGELEIQDCKILGNSTSQYGGGMYISGMYETNLFNMSNSIVCGNSSVNSGGAIYFSAGYANIYNSSITKNYSSTDRCGGIRNVTQMLSLYNTIVSLNETGHASTVQNLLNDPYDGNITLTNSMINTDPIFVSNPTAGADGIWATSDDFYGDLRLKPNSTAIDSGNNSYALDTNGNTLSTDIDGSTRIIDGTVDIGAQEYQNLPADINGDEVVNISDFLILKSYYGTYTTLGKAAGDLDNDGDVDIDDFLIFKPYYN